MSTALQRPRLYQHDFLQVFASLRRRPLQHNNNNNNKYRHHHKQEEILTTMGARG